MKLQNKNKNKYTHAIPKLSDSSEFILRFFRIYSPFLLTLKKCFDNTTFNATQIKN